MYLTDLADVVRSAGLDVEEVPGWKTRGHGGMTSVDGTVNHHTAGPATGDYPSLNTVTSGRKGLSGPLCNLGLGRSGKVYVVAAGLAYHAGAVRSTSYTNGRRIGIEAEATGRDGVTTDWPTVQLRAYARLNAALALRYHFSARDALGHKEVCAPVGRKIDPHPMEMSRFREDVDREIGVLGGTSRGGGRPPLPDATPSRPVLARGARGSAVRQLQARLVALGWDVGRVDGVFLEQTERAVIGLQVAAGLVADGVVGPRTWPALDGGQRPRFVVHGLVGRGDSGADVVDVQRALCRVGIPVDVDGRFGNETWRGVRRRQAQADLDDDGIVGEATAAALGGKAA